MLCEQLEDYICRLLDPAATARFETHLSNCDACHSAVERERNLFGLLTEAVVTLEPCPPRLRILKPVPVAVPQSEPARSRFALIISAAALALMAFAALRTQPESQPRDNSGDKVARVETPVMPPPAVTIHGNGYGFPIESGDPNIRIIMVHSVPPQTENMLEIPQP